jgi:hypothetical protein
MKDTTSCQSGSIYLRICWGDIRSSSALSPTLMTLSKTWQLHSQCIGIYFSKDGSRWRRRRRRRRMKFVDFLIKLSLMTKPR